AHSRRGGHRDPLGPVPRDAHRGRRGRAHRGTTHRARRRRRSPMTDRGAPRSASTLTSEKRRRLEARLLAGAPAARTTLPRRDPGAPVPLSPPQQRLWFLHQLVPDSAVYHIPIVARLSGPLDVEALRRSLEAIVHRHEALRAAIVVEDGDPAPRLAHPPEPPRAPMVVEDGEPRQRIPPTGPSELPLEEWPGDDPAAIERAAVR